LFEKLYKKIFPILNFIPPELAHNLAIKFFTNFKNKIKSDDLILNIKVCNLQFTNPIGLAAGFDKNGEAYDGLMRLGFGFVEIGTVTINPQFGNKKPRIFRLLEDKAIINRLGFNNIGAEKVLQNIEKYDSANGIGLLGVNLGKNSDSKELIEDYVKLLKIFNRKASYITLNVSSPNTPGLRELEKKDNLDKLVKKISLFKRKNSVNIPFFLKIDPDISKNQLGDIADIVLSSRIDGVIISNTSIHRSNELISKYANEKGGISGLPIREISNKLLKDFYILTNGKIPLIGVGGISNGKDAYERILNGASLIQLYTSLIYKGPSIVNKIKKELVYLLKKDNYKSLDQAVGKLNK
jgi:dihydroorotate dehydrogenase